MSAPAPCLQAGALPARRLRVGGRVQGVGFRPFTEALARRLGLSGWVRNHAAEVEIHVQGDAAALEAFLAALRAEAPALARIETLTANDAPVEQLQGFAIRASAPGAGGSASIAPDQSVCPACLAESRDPADRRHGHVFVSCTQCGPRYSLLDRLPYDRANTSMAGFALCATCEAEYLDRDSRRHHAQTLACPDCGPRLAWRVPGRPEVQGDEAALAACLAALRAGGIVAVKGVGGYHLLCDARSDAALERLRERKHRPVKPFAVLLSERLLGTPGALAGLAEPTHAELARLGSPERPIVLMRAARASTLSPRVAPGLAEIGLLLPYSPLHHRLAEDFGGPLVATSANPSGEPVLTEPAQAEARLGGVADGFLHHDRPIRRPAEDSVFRTLGGQPRPLRLGRGHAPLELPLPTPLARPLLALGADLKNAPALGAGARARLAPHLGDLGSPRSLALLEQVTGDLARLYGLAPAGLVADAHPDCWAARWAAGRGLPLRRVHHHHAHASALWAEAVAAGAPARTFLVFTWDGLGYGPDGSLWGGETLLGRPGAWRRVASLRPFRLIGGEAAAREPWRPALALCLEAGREWPDRPAHAGLAAEAWARRLNCPETSSAGRLFDAAAALLGLVQRQSHEGEAAMRLEALAGGARCPAAAPPLPWRREAALWRLDWAPLLGLLLDAQVEVAARAAAFHFSLAAAIAGLAARLATEHGFDRVGLAGGVFQNALLCREVIRGLGEAGLEPMLPAVLPVNDAAIAYGQLVEAAACQAREAPGAAP